MERNLFIIRHGKSSWDHDGLDDIDRPLAERGSRNAKDMANRLIERGLIPELIFTSPANRALNTALIMSRIWELEADAIQIHDSLYLAYESEIEQLIRGAPPSISNLAIFGHNPSFTLFANQFLEEPMDNLPTAGVVIVTMEADGWNEIGRGKVNGIYVDYPKKKH